MEFHTYVLDLADHFINSLLIFLVLRYLLFRELYTNDDFLKKVVVHVMIYSYFLPLLKLFLQFKIHSECLRVDLVQARQKVLAEVLVVLVQVFQNQNAWNCKENVCIAAFHHLLKLLVFL